MPRSILHYTDQRSDDIYVKRPTAVCGVRAPRHRFIDLTPKLIKEGVGCVGCRAILIERAKEKARMANGGAA